MVSAPVLVVAFIVIILVILVVALRIISETSGEGIANKTCKKVAEHFDPTIFTIVGIRPSHFLCDIVVPKI